jgi:DnaJ like chaperone protein
VSWDRAFGERSRQPAVNDDDPYLELGVTRAASGEELRATWKRLMRENHPDSLASRGVPADFVARAGEKVARINAAWDRIKRERGL